MNRSTAKRRRLAVVLCILVALAACRPLFSVCHACFKSDPALPVPLENIAKIDLMDKRARLPKSARNVFYHEECGIDCTLWIRFDGPARDARAFAARTLRRPLVKNVDPMRETVSNFAGPGYAWWPDRFPADAEGAATTVNEDSVPKGIVLLQKGQSARVWVAVVET